jgi:DNA end-binding protein Ku
MLAPSSSTATTPLPPVLAEETEAGTSPAPRGRASWSGLLQVSLVTVPVKAYPVADASQETHFHQLHIDCGERIRYEKHCPVHGKVDAAAIGRGYPYAPDQDVLLDDAELEKLRPEKDRALTLERFVDPEQVDPSLFSGRSLGLLPDGPAAHHPYLVLSQAMRQRRKWAVGRAVLGSHRQLTLVRPAGPLLVLHVLHYPDHLRAGAAFRTELRDEVISADESKLAGLLVDTSSPATMAWSDYRDDTAEQLAALVQAKLGGQPLPAPAAEPAPVLRLLDALRQSVAQATGQPAAGVPEAAPVARGRKSKTARRSA